jgi:hypothetical protein
MKIKNITDSHRLGRKTAKECTHTEFIFNGSDEENEKMLKFLQTTKLVLHARILKNDKLLTSAEFSKFTRQFSEEQAEMKVILGNHDLMLIGGYFWELDED